MGEFSGSSESALVLVNQVYLKAGWVGWLDGWLESGAEKKDDNVYVVNAGW